VAAEEECEGEVKCEGTCTGQCSGGCEGNAKPPSCQGECEAKADCEASASAQASAEVKCEPPSLDISYSLSAGVAGNAAAEAAFMAKLDVFKAKMAAIAQGLAEVKSLVEGTGEGAAHVDGPLIQVSGQLRGLANAAANGELNIAAGLILCATDAIAEVGGIVSQVQTDASVVITGSVSMMAIIGG
jgi:hypothetical protein